MGADPCLRQASFWDFARHRDAKSVCCTDNRPSLAILGCKVMDVWVDSGVARRVGHDRKQRFSIFNISAVSSGPPLIRIRRNSHGDSRKE